MRFGRVRSAEPSPSDRPYPQTEPQEVLKEEVRRGREATRGVAAGVLLAVAATAIGVLAGWASGDSGSPAAASGRAAPQRAEDATWTTVFTASGGIEGLTNDKRGNLYVAQRGATTADNCPVWRIAIAGGASTRIGFLPAPCSPSNGGPLEFPTSPVLAGRTLCTTSSDGARRDNFPNTAGEVSGNGKISCLDQRLDGPGVPLPVR